ncbi:DUF3141 domain-containing protein [Caulobacter sp. 17J65-9]|uniref:DUF3141 domain-containing protein n=1 Tax=Caulobacter sp. 17J65-9 TaxID=2709382 RepID=UPI0013CD1C8D|nr:DUF3141 domain-containing protein [Caulobacter sp. 17J65-9]NEX92179.1 DUF3141 domain-containing protein [Caulobacter sp. 17J65-9]
MSAWRAFGAMPDYWVDAWQRSILFLDILRERGNGYWEHNAATAPNVLSFAAEELILDGRSLPRPVNYGLVRIKPPDGVKTDPAKPPYIVVDPRAGHGPGIGGMKQDSEIGVALAAGHPCYFIGFLPQPVPGQTIEDVCEAEAAFIAEVVRRHPQAEGRPVIVANCQAGWQVMMTAALHPELTGPIVLAGSPLSYWAGERGKNPLRYLGGVLGGTWMTALAGDLGDGVFDGAALVANFESLDLANTYWEKPYNVYSKVDTEGPRFLDFETWWGSPVLLNAGEMQWIADNLFVGNKLSTGALRTSDGVRIDLRNIRSPVVVFCSWGDNITPPQQALGWITDIYDHEREIAANGQTIVYCLHQTIGHLGIFVSGKVATKEHREFTSCMDMIDLAPPGLYEAVITEVEPDTANPNLIDGRWLFSLQPRTVSDVAEIVGERADDDLRFAAVARVSETNLALYRSFLQPAVQAMATPLSAEVLRWTHPNRLRFAAFSDVNPLMKPVEGLAKAVREGREPAEPDNPLVAIEKATANWISASLQAYGLARDAMTEAAFVAAYGARLTQAAAGLDRQAPRRHIERDLVREADEARLRSDLEQKFEIGGPSEAAARALIYVNRPGGSFDERGSAMFKVLRAAQPADERLPAAELKELVKEQDLLLRLDEERAIQAIPKLLPPDAGRRKRVLDEVHGLVEARGHLAEEGRRRLKRVDALFEMGAAGHA